MLDLNYELEKIPNPAPANKHSNMTFKDRQKATNFLARYYKERHPMDNDQNMADKFSNTRALPFYISYANYRAMRKDLNIPASYKRDVSKKRGDSERQMTLDDEARNVELTELRQRVAGLEAYTLELIRKVHQYIGVDTEADHARAEKRIDLLNHVRGILTGDDFKPA